MPIYEYECPVCGVVEAMQGINDSPLAKCPACGKRKVKKLISNTNFQLKGTGWYVTDYARGNGNGNGKSRDRQTDKPSPGAEKKETATQTSKQSSKSSSGDSAKASA